MSQVFGIEKHAAHAPAAHRAPVDYMVVIDSGGVKVARLYLGSRQLVNEFDAAVPEVVAMTSGRAPTVGAMGSEWDLALQGHSAQERASAEVYALRNQ